MMNEPLHKALQLHGKWGSRKLLDSLRRAGGVALRNVAPRLTSFLRYLIAMIAYQTNFATTGAHASWMRFKRQKVRTDYDDPYEPSQKSCDASPPAGLRRGLRSSRVFGHVTPASASSSIVLSSPARIPSSSAL